MPSPLQSRRLKISVACEHCRSRKIKCDGVRPACNNCRRKVGRCTYRRGVVADRSSRPLPPSSSPLPFPHPHPHPSSERPDGQELPRIPSGTVHGLFAGEVTAAVDARLGLASSGRPSLTPMTDAPLFGLLPRRQVADGTAHRVENVLPQRKHADYLMDIYWRHIQPLEPFLEQERFCRSYQALFAGGSLEADERIFVSTLNIVFALATQLQECMPPEDREEASNTYFHRAWALLRPETIIWEPGSLELVQCLLLMTRYLQCTNNPHQTWMAVGFAVRIAQSLGLHLPESLPSSGAPKRDSRLRRQVWQCCVYMDRIVSWVLGRTSMIPLAVSSATISDDPGCQNSEASASYLTKTLELYEICNHIMLSQVSAGSSVADKLGLPGLYQHDEPFSNASRLDACLNQWEKNLPQSLRFDDSLDDDADNISQAVHLHLRLLHGRISLFRPMLARYCLSRPQTATGAAPTPDRGRLSDRILQDCASLCVDNAQKMISVVDDRCRRRRLAADGAVGVVPWWYRVFYLHVAGTVLVAATLRADLYTPALTRSWYTAMAGLRAHEHLSPFVRQCVAAFQALSVRISPESMHQQQHQQPGGERERHSASPAEAASNNATYFQDVFQEMGLANPDNLLFGMEDMSWLGNFEFPLPPES